MRSGRRYGPRRTGHAGRRVASFALAAATAEPHCFTASLKKTASDAATTAGSSAQKAQSSAWRASLACRTIWHVPLPGSATSVSDAIFGVALLAPTPSRYNHSRRNAPTAFLDTKTSVRPQFPAGGVTFNFCSDRRRAGAVSRRKSANVPLTSASKIESMNGAFSPKLSAAIPATAGATIPREARARQ